MPLGGRDYVWHPSGMGFFYGRRAWQRLREQVLHDANYQCAGCGVSLIGKGRKAHVHHRKALNSTPALALEPQNLQALCVRCHNTIEPRSTLMNDVVRPTLPLPTCRVMLVCGPPGAGKNTYVAKHATPEDTVIDYDAIAQERGYLRDVPFDQVRIILQERNRRLATLSTKPANHVAWVIITAASNKLRQWWCAALGVKPDDLVLLVPNQNEIKRRIAADPTRKHVLSQQNKIVKQWFAREQANHPGYIASGCNANGEPTDPLHPWNALPGGRV